MCPARFFFLHYECWGIDMFGNGYSDFYHCVYWNRGRGYYLEKYGCFYYIGSGNHQSFNSTDVDSVKMRKFPVMAKRPTPRHLPHAHRRAHQLCTVLSQPEIPIPTGWKLYDLAVMGDSVHGHNPLMFNNSTE